MSCDVDGVLSVFCWSCPGSCPRVSSAGVLFTKHPANQTVSQGNTIRLGCAVQGVTEPDIVWMKDGEKLYSTDQMFITVGEQHWETFHRFIRSTRSVTTVSSSAPAVIVKENKDVLSKSFDCFQCRGIKLQHCTVKTHELNFCGNSNRK